MAGNSDCHVATKIRQKTGAGALHPPGLRETGQKTVTGARYQLSGEYNGWIVPLVKTGGREKKTHGSKKTLPWTVGFRGSGGNTKYRRERGGGVLNYFG